jgi:hypothetical protein
MAAGDSAGARFSTRDLVYIAILGAAWGLVETSLGTYLHALRIPFRGALLTALGLLVALCGRALIAKRGTLIMIGAVTAALRLLAVGAVLLSPLAAILIESLLAELVLWPWARPGRAAFALAGAAGTLWTVVHPFVAQGLVAGSGLVAVYGWLIESTARALPLLAGLVWVLVVCAIAIPLALGIVAGLLAHDLGARLQERLAH